MATNDKLAALAAHFDDTDTGQRSQGGRKFDYISIDKTIGRLNKVLGADWSFEINNRTIEDAGVPDNKGNKQWLATVDGELTALDKVASGTGADIATDPDKAVKTALAEAIKKAGHQFGIALYLWNEDDRNILQTQRTLTTAVDAAKASGDTLKEAKTLLAKLALKQGAKASREAILAHFSMTPTQYEDEAVIRGMLDKHSR